jgi:3-hydroxy acid dehydrogenase/malonic semialdehyde reductase
MKTALVTGATSGFGWAIAEKFAKEGYQLIISGRRLGRLQELAEKLDTPTHIMPLDVCDRKAVDNAVDTLPDAFKNIDVLVNNAGLALGLEPAHKADLDEWITMVETNIKGLLYCTRKILPSMVENGRGHVVNIGSIAGNYPYPGGNVYGATKAFVNHFSLNLKADLLGTPVRVTSIEPGLANTEFSKVRFGGDAEKADSIYEGLEPLTANDIAEAVYWVASQPTHVNINRMEIMPTCQASGALAISRD